MPPATAVIVSARNEAERLGATLRALREAFPDARLLVADDASTDATADVARDAGAEVVSAHRQLADFALVYLSRRNRPPVDT